MAVLSALAFEGATKKNRPNLKVTTIATIIIIIIIIIYCGK
jgi:hypothetical protein